MIQSLLILWILYHIDAPTMMIVAGWLCVIGKTAGCLADILD